MKKRTKWWTAVLVTLMLGILVLPEAYAYFTQRSYESNAVADSETPEGFETATFAGGCFWCMEAPFEKLAGVDEVISGYIGGSQTNPSYEEVSGGETDHVEAVQVYFDPEVITYAELLSVFWRQIDPTDKEGQFADRGAQYTTAIFYHSKERSRRKRQSNRRLKWKHLDVLKKK
ncbi:peptide-methionine (S)-S-oxide reductase MsrA [Halobacillus sp. A5]|uniref:peptide-methionine (S)-S-oxide reductase MsrA n=1 Tax=Halobacillus sp. A5 TaxID=2880263 RepID=UPI0020A6300D|nr:peptide-methionine (S)-S-oxide reductase MsrA [Halobacillus sp. A5]